MNNPEMSPIVRTMEDVDTHLAALLVRDPRLVPFAEKSGEVPLRILGHGFPALVQIIVGQLLSVAAAKAIHDRLVVHLEEVSPRTVIAADDEALRALGLSWNKIRGLNAIAQQIDSGAFDFDGLADLDAETALARLMDLPGVGRWTAEIYLISGLGHADYFPAGDLVLRKIVGLVIGADAVPSESEVRDIALGWSPHRAVAARLLWRYFAVLRDREGINL